MNYYGNPMTRLIEELAALPGIGGKSAQRLAFHIINLPREKVAALSEAILAAKDEVKYCSVCCNLTEEEICPVCANPGFCTATMWSNCRRLPRNTAACAVTTSRSTTCALNISHYPIVPNRANAARRCITPSRASSLPKWNMWQSART